ncbi:MAG TPA: hypothetical protein VGL08_13140 [Paraburkholderia sp.]|jgi:hypothetical protein
MTTASANESDIPDDPSNVSPTEASKPIGTAIPTPVEPGLDQPLPEKGELPTTDNPSPGNRPRDGSAGNSDETPIGDTDPPKGVPSPGPSDFA